MGDGHFPVATVPEVFFSKSVCPVGFYKRHGLVLLICDKEKRIAHGRFILCFRSVRLIEFIPGFGAYTVFCTSIKP